MKVPPDVIVQEILSAGYTLKADDRELLPHQVLMILAVPGH